MTYSKIFITGGAGFIGANATAYFLKQGKEVTILDNFSRPGSLYNLKWLEGFRNKNLRVIRDDIKKNTKKLRDAVKRADLILHLAGQVAVTTSITNPREDFETNALGTLNVLEAVRLSGHNPMLVYSSTNKVYGNLVHLPTKEDPTRYTFHDLPNGINEDQPLDFHSPYGCSKGTADQYVRDYHRMYGLNTIVFRQSCIYGPRQFGMEDQGWLAWFMICALKGKSVHIYGNGKQIRDLLYVDDLINAYDLAAAKITKTRGQIYNIGGGTKNTLSIWKECKPILERLFKKTVLETYAPARTGDQQVFVSDIRKSKRDFGWEPTVGVQEGMTKLYTWIQENKNLFLTS